MSKTKSRKIGGMSLAKLPTDMEAKLASIIVHLAEYCSSGRDPSDIMAARDILNDPSVVETMNQLEGTDMLPKTRSRKSVQELLS